MQFRHIMAESSPRALRAFLAVVNHGTVSEAARQMNMSQPALGRLIQGLEADLGVSLFTRQRKRLRPTEMALDFAREVERVLANFDELPRMVSEYETESASVLRVAAVPRLAYSLVAPAFQRVRQRFPKARLVIDARPGREIERWVNSKVYDLGLATLPIYRSKTDIELFGRVPLHVIMRNDDPMAGRDEIEIRDIQSPMVLPINGNLMRERIDNAYRSARLNPISPVETSSSALACYFVSQGFGCTISDPYSVDIDPGRLCSTPLIPRSWLELAFVGPKLRKSSSLSDAFRQAIRAEVTERGGEMIAGDAASS
ncbi:MAG: LysR family transcriptional regulator [Rhodospirillales bacterium]